MASNSHGSEPNCDCPAHNHAPPGASGQSGALGSLARLAPVFACLLCPVCLSSYAKLFSVFGFGLAPSHSHALFWLALAISLLSSAQRSYASKQIWPLAVASLAVGLIGLGHVAGLPSWLEWLGLAILLGSALGEQIALRTRH